MIAYYQFQARRVDTDTPLAESETVETKRESSPVEGLYSSADGPIEAEGKRISYFQVTAREDGSFGGIARVETIGAEGGTDLACLEVKASETELFLRCGDEVHGSISFEGKIEQAEGLSANGRLLWQREGNVLLDRSARLSHSP